MKGTCNLKNFVIKESNITSFKLFALNAYKTWYFMLKENISRRYLGKWWRKNIWT